MARAGLTRDLVLDAANSLVEAHGIAGLSMRRVAAAVGVEAMSLYHHVDDRADLERGLSDRVWAAVDLARDEPDWRLALHRLCGSAHRTLLARPWFFDLPLANGGPERLAVIDATLLHLERGGLPTALAFHAQHVLDGHVYGYSWQAIGFAGAAVDGDELAAMIAGLAGHPHLVAHARQHLDPPPGDGFAIGLDLILDGLERTVARR
jgi:AcrR family transcriptional regulator